MLKIFNFYVLSCKTNSFFFFTLIREEDKNIFDYCRENNIDRITKAIKSKTVEVNVKDDEVWKTSPITSLSGARMFGAGTLVSLMLLLFHPNVISNCCASQLQFEQLVVRASQNIILREETVPTALLHCKVRS